eukprot:1564754-Rhodomonas_salina.3
MTVPDTRQYPAPYAVVVPDTIRIAANLPPPAYPISVPHIAIPIPYLISTARRYPHTLISVARIAIQCKRYSMTLAQHRSVQPPILSQYRSSAYQQYQTRLRLSTTHDPAQLLVPSARLCLSTSHGVGLR